MNKNVFHIIVTGLSYFTVLGLLLQVAQTLMLLPMIMPRSEVFDNGDYSYASGASVNGVTLHKINEPIINVSVQLETRDILNDTTINLKGQYSSTKLIRQRLYNAADSFAYQHDTGRPVLLEQIKNGTLVPIDTVTTTLSLVERDSARQYAMPSYQRTKAVLLDTSFVVTNQPNDFRGTMSLKIKNRSEGWPIVVANYLKLITPSFTLWFTAWHFLWLLWNFKKKIYFSLQNFRRLRWIGLGLALSGVSSYVIDYCNGPFLYKLINLAVQFETYHNGQFIESPVNFRLAPYSGAVITNLNFWIGLVFITLAEIFRKGLEIQQENELTI